MEIPKEILEQLGNTEEIKIDSNLQNNESEEENMRFRTFRNDTIYTNKSRVLTETRS